MWPNPQETADLVTFTEEIFNGKLHFLCRDLEGFLQGPKYASENKFEGVIEIPTRLPHQVSWLIDHVFTNPMRHVFTNPCSAPVHPQRDHPKVLE